MAYTMKNYRTKKTLKEDFAQGKRIQCYQPGPFPLKAPGRVTLEGPHYPEPHRWYATAELDAQGYIISLK